MNLLNTFQRKTASTHFIPEIDGLRFFAIFTVLIFHFNTAYSRALGFDDLALNVLGRVSISQPGWWLVRLDLGVKVFFAISGMVLALPFLNHYLKGGPSVKLKDYFVRRLTRLEPPFLITLLFFLMVHVLFLGKEISSMLPHFWAGLIYAHLFIYGFPNPINPVTWSLETETQFYLIIPFFFSVLFFKRSPVYLFLIILFTFSMSIWLKALFIQEGLTHFSSSLLAYFSNFITGILVAFLFVNHNEYVKSKSVGWDFVGFIAIIIQFYFYKPQHIWYNNLLFNSGIFLMMLSTFKGYIFNWLFTRPMVYIIGGMCYSIYLLHFAFFFLWVKVISGISLGMGYGYDLLFHLVFAIAAMLLVSAAFFYFIEKPCMNKQWPTHLLKWLKS